VKFSVFVHAFCDYNDAFTCMHHTMDAPAPTCNCNLSEVGLCYPNQREYTN